MVSDEMRSQAAAQGMQRLMAMHDANIERVGWSVVAVGGDGDAPPFAYTVGFTSHDLPELFMAGLPINMLYAFLNDLGKRALDGAQWQHGERITDLLDGYPVMVVEGPPIEDMRPGLAAAMYGPEQVRLQQVVWPDQAGLFPWEAGYAIDAEAQPVIGDPDKRPLPTSAAGPGRMWLLWDVERGAWWKQGGYGHTLDITEAQRFSQADAVAKAAEPQQPGHELIPCPEPTGRVPVPAGLDSRLLRELADGIDDMAAISPFPLDDRVAAVRALLNGSDLFPDEPAVDRVRQLPTIEQILHAADLMLSRAYTALSDAADIVRSDWSPADAVMTPEQSGQRRKVFAAVQTGKNAINEARRR